MLPSRARCSQLLVARSPSCPARHGRLGGRGARHSLYHSLDATVPPATIALQQHYSAFGAALVTPTKTAAGQPQGHAPPELPPRILHRLCGRLTSQERAKGSTGRDMSSVPCKTLQPQISRIQGPAGDRLQPQSVPGFANMDLSTSCHQLTPVTDVPHGQALLTGLYQYPVLMP